MGLKNQILNIALFTPLRQVFDYLPNDTMKPAELRPGVRLSIPFQGREKIGILVGVKENSDVPFSKLKKIISVLDDQPILNQDILYLCQWTANYYHASLGDVFMTALPKHVRLGKETNVKRPTDDLDQICETPHILSLEQQLVLTKILAAKNTFQTFLLDGVTGSGKTEVYLQAISNIIEAGKQALILVPEISLTPQTIARFKKRFAVPVVSLHSGLSDKKRLLAWLAAKNGEAKIIIGTRSAIFTPCTNLGLIIVDEEHDTSFKQQDRTRYNARDLALVRAKYNNIPVILGSATPSLESYLNAERGRYKALVMQARTNNASLPQYDVIDLTKCQVEDGLSEPMRIAIQKHLAEGNQVLIFLNRRGFAPVLYCIHCQHIMQCTRCDTRLVYHKKPPRLQCHRCDTIAKIPSLCSQCGSRELQPLGVGTQRLENKLHELFKNIPIIRIDRDSTKRKGSMDELLSQMQSNQPAILIGTQMIAKGHHFPNVTLTCIVDIDVGLLSSDYRAVEQIGQLVVQVGGRAGRDSKKGFVLIQTRNPEHELLQILLKNNYRAFSQRLLQERFATALPPYSHCAVFKAEAYEIDKAQTFLLNLKHQFDALQQGVALYGPYKPIVAKKKGLHQWQLLIKSSSRKVLQTFLHTVVSTLDAQKKHPARWAIDVDPITE